MDLGKRIERRLKRTIFGWMAGKPSTTVIAPTAVELQSVRRVLVVRPNFRMGNLLLITPALAALREALPGRRIDVIGTGDYLSLLAHSPDIDGLIQVNRHSFTPRNLLRLARYLREANYDLAIDGARGSSFLGACVVGLSRARYRVGSAEGRYRRFFNVPVAVDRGSLHKVDLLLSLLDGIGIPAASREMKVVLTDAEQLDAATLWQELGLARRRHAVGINLGARGEKRLPAEQIVTLARELHATDDLAIVLFAGPEDADTLAQIRHHLPDGAVVAPRLSVRAFAAMLARCTVVVTADTGPMHLAAAVGTPTVTLMVDPRSAYYRPLGAQHRVLARRGRTDVADVVGAVRELVPS
jgi:heptosyltransferase-3